MNPNRTTVSPAARTTRLLCLLGALTGLACDEGSDGQPIFVDLRAPDGSNPLAAGDEVRITVTHGDAVDERTATVGQDRRLDLRIGLTDRVTATRISLILITEGSGTALAGSTPTFLPAEAAGLVTIPLLAPGACAPVAGLTTAAPGGAPALAQHGTFLSVLGGQDNAGPSPRAGFIDLLQFTSSDLKPLTVAVGQARAVIFDARNTLVWSDHTSPLLFDLTSAEAPEKTIAAHAAANTAATALPLRDGGALLAGGGTESEPARGWTWIRADGVTVQGTLTAARHRPALAEVPATGGQGVPTVWVFGGQRRVDEPSAEIITLPPGARDPADPEEPKNPENPENNAGQGFDIPLPRGGVALTRPDATVVWVGADPDNPTRVLSVSGCPPCAVEEDIPLPMEPTHFELRTVDGRPVAIAWNQTELAFITADPDVAVHRATFTEPAVSITPVPLTTGAVLTVHGTSNTAELCLPHGGTTSR